MSNVYRSLAKASFYVMRVLVRRRIRVEVGGGSMKHFKILFAFLVMLVVTTPVDAQTKRIAVAYSAISATQSAFYLAKDAKLFEKHGLYVDPVYVAGGSRVSQAVIAGEFTVALAGGNIVNADLAGADIVVIGGVVNVPSFYLFVQPSIKGKEELRGKTFGDYTLWRLYGFHFALFAKKVGN